MRQPLFKRGLDYVAVSHVRLSADTVLEPGTPIEGLRVFHLKDLHRRRKIGPVGDPWTENMLEAAGKGKKNHRPESKAVRHEEPKSQVPNAVEPFMHQDENGFWVLGDGQVFETLDEALAAWHNSVGTEDPTADDDKPGDEGNGDGQTEPTEPTEPTGQDDKPEEPKAEEKKAEDQEPPEPQKVGSQWVIDGVDGKFTSGKKAKEAWLKANDPLEN